MAKRNATSDNLANEFQYKNNERSINMKEKNIPKEKFEGSCKFVDLLTMI